MRKKISLIIFLVFTLNISFGQIIKEQEFYSSSFNNIHTNSSIIKDSIIIKVNSRNNLEYYNDLKFNSNNLKQRSVLKPIIISEDSIKKIEKDLKQKAINSGMIYLNSENN